MKKTVFMLISLTAAFLLDEDFDAAVISNEGLCLIFHPSALNPKTTRSTQGVHVLETLDNGWREKMDKDYKKRGKK